MYTVQLTGTAVNKSQEIFSDIPTFENLEIGSASGSGSASKWNGKSNPEPDRRVRCRCRSTSLYHESFIAAPPQKNLFRD
jgi:hypothetical protein